MSFVCCTRPSPEFIQQHKYEKIFSINLFCCQFNYYENVTHLLQELLCFIPPSCYKRH